MKGKKADAGNAGSAGSADKQEKKQVTFAEFKAKAVITPAADRKPLIRHVKPQYMNGRDNIWNMQMRRVTSQFIPIDQSYANMEGYPVPASFKGTLRPHQSTLVRQMIEHEDRRQLTIYQSSFYTDIGYLAEPFGSGKTIMSYRLMCHGPPKPRPIITHNTSHGIYARKPRKILKCNFVVMSTTMTMQWESEGVKFTDFKIFTIKTVRELREFDTKLNNGSINDYDVILIKNSAISSNKFEISYDIKDKTVTDPRTGKEITLNIAGNVYVNNATIDRYNELIKSVGYNIPAIVGILCYMRDTAASRLFLDDFDTIGMNTKTTMLPMALFTWMISATNAISKTEATPPEINPLTVDPEAKFTENYALNSIGALTSVITNMSTLSMRNTTEYIKSSIEMFKIKYYNYHIKSVDDDMFEILQSMGGGDEYLDMFNANATSTLSKQLNIKSASVGDLMNKIIGNKRDDLIKTLKNLEELEKIRKSLDKKAETYDSREIIHYNAAQEREIAQKLLQGSCPYPPIKQVYTILTRITNEQEAKKKDLSKELERVRSNVRQDKCPVCLIDLEFEDLFLTRCCGGIVCSDCAPKSIFRNRSTMTGMCPSCGHNGTSLKNCIYCPGEVDISKILEVDLSAINEVDPNAEPEPMPPKIEVLMKILNGEGEQCDRELIDKIPGTTRIVDGDASSTDEARGIAPKPHNEKKFVIYAGYDDPFKLIKECLDKEGRKYLQLTGTVYGRRKTLDEFRESKDINILLAHNRRDISGINLQFADAIIAYHNPPTLDEMEQQVARLQRYGRTRQPEIHRLVHANEVKFVERKR